MVCSRLGPPVFPSTHWSVLMAADDGSPPGIDWASFSRVYKSVVHAWFRAKGVQDADADDLTAAFLERMLKSFHLYRPADGDFRPWLVTILSNLLRDFHKTRQRRPEYTVGGDASGDDYWCRLAAPESVADLLSAVESAGQRRMAAAMAAVEAKVQPHTWQAFVAHAVNGQPAPEVAAALGMTVTAVHTARYRTLNLIKAEYLRLAEEHSG